ncbi:MAG TPA: hypothetical protein PKY78_02840 [Candidatus Omnitrophota bacterium]|nr:hypothetical protein [Candidatus Omnitrophota bacterium]HPS19911.1 hypothetical protein [Candidatus Omnitrophota bacterium]
MAAPHVKYRMRPKKTGAKKRQRVKAQKKRLEKAGYSKDALLHMTEKDIRTNLRKAMREKKA